MTGRSILVAGILMHFMFNATLIFLAGIFGSFSVPPSYWIVQPVVYLVAATGVVLIWKSKAPAGEFGRQPDALPVFQG